MLHRASFASLLALALAALALGAVTPACTTPRPTADGGSGGDPDAPSPVDTGVEVDAFEAPIDAPSTAPDAPSTGIDSSVSPDSSTPVDGGSRACGTRGTGPCPLGLTCIWPLDAACGSFDAPGTCQTQPEACPRIYLPVCGCDGVTYPNECEAHRAGTSASRAGTCGSCDLDNVSSDCTMLPRCLMMGHVPEVIDGCSRGCVAATACTCSLDSDCPALAPNCDTGTGLCTLP